MKQFSPGQIVFALLVAAILVAAMVYRHFTTF